MFSQLAGATNMLTNPTPNGPIYDAVDRDFQSTVSDENVLAHLSGS